MRDLTAEEWDEVRAAVALPGWRWMPGMRGTGDGYRDHVTVLDTELNGTPDMWFYRGGVRGTGPDGTEWWDDCLPDPRDPATAGCLLALLGGYRATRKTIAGTWCVDTDGVVELCASDILGLAVIRCALDRGRWGA